MPADAKLGLFVGLCLVVVAAWVYRQGAPRPAAEPAVTAVADEAPHPVLAADPSH